jgi:hypothetical protein
MSNIDDPIGPRCDCEGRPSKCGSGDLSYCIGDPATEPDIDDGNCGGLYDMGEGVALFGCGSCCEYWPIGADRFVGGVDTGLGGQPYPPPCWG